MKETKVDWESRSGRQDGAAEFAKDMIGFLAFHRDLAMKSTAWLPKRMRSK
jgi:hypothetical protein